MDLVQLRTFTTVARRGSFSAAARELGYTQSAVSQHIAALESTLGAVLLQRRPVVPTTVGARLLEHAGPLLLRVDAARADIARLTTAPAARIAIGISPLAMTPRVAQTLAEADVQVSVRVAGRSTVVREIAAGTLDLGLVDGMTAPNDPLHLPNLGPLTSVAIAEHPLVVALPVRHPLANRTGLRLADTPGVVAVPLTEPRLVHRTEALHINIVDGPVAALAAALQ
jgi:DNA-binding transcriptional LysR family regulator